VSATEPARTRAPGTALIAGIPIRPPARRRRRLGRGIGLLGNIVATGLGIGIIALSVSRQRPDEARAGALVLLVALWLGIWLLRSRAERRLLPSIAALGWALQVAATMAYYYSGVAVDAVSFDRTATRIVEQGERLAFSAPNWGNEGLLLVLSGLYRVTGPSMLLGFVVFALIGLTGKVLFARSMLALRPLLGAPAEFAAFTAVIIPSFAWWTGAISKESIVILGMGLVFASLFRGPDAAPHLPGIVAGLALITVVRAHVTLLLAAAVYVYLLVAFRLPARRGGRRPILIVLSSAVVAGSLVLGVNYLGSDGLGGLEDSRVQLAERSQAGGSTIPTRPIRSPSDVAPAVANLLLRPFPWEAFNALAAAQAAESVVVVVFALGTLLRSRRKRRQTYAQGDDLQVRALRWFTLTYSAGFIYAFSAVAYNLGLISRQRSQIWFVLLLAFALANVGGRRGKASSRFVVAPFARFAAGAPAGADARHATAQ
jgi:hypothetical protein